MRHGSREAEPQGFVPGPCRPGRKILVSGGGRCNFTNLHMGAEHYISRNRHYCKSALARYTQYDFIAFPDSHGITYHERKSGQLFCDRSAQALLTVFLDACRQAGVVIRSGCHIHQITGEKGSRVESSHGNFESPSLVVATGGLSYPQLGASDLGYRIAIQYGLEVVPPRPNSHIRTVLSGRLPKRLVERFCESRI